MTFTCHRLPPPPAEPFQIWILNPGELTVPVLWVNVPHEPLGKGPLGGTFRQGGFLQSPTPELEAAETFRGPAAPPPALCPDLLSPSLGANPGCPFSCWSPGGRSSSCPGTAASTLAGGALLARPHPLWGLARSSPSPDSSPRLSRAVLLLPSGKMPFACLLGSMMIV